MRCGSKTMPPTTWTPCEALMFVMSAGRGVEDSFSRKRWGGMVEGVGESTGASKGERSFSLPSQR